MNQTSKPAASFDAKCFLLLSLSVCGLASHHLDGFAPIWSNFFFKNPCIFSVIGIFLAAALVILAARATMITWITVLVLLACSGRRRHSLVLDGKKITIDVALQFVEVLLSERSRVVLAAACATIWSILANVGCREGGLSNLKY
uniref:Uncharacterized protein n=1 Tax=Kalanchoe fedtschenkoi TaxID=63787 RepID=A0A7N0TZE7_KALFE